MTAARWTGLALGVFCAGLALHLRPLFGHDPRAFVLAGRTAAEQSEEPGARGYDFTSSDRRFSAWLVARNAAALASRPHRLFDAAPCYPAEHSLALGHPGLALGLLGVPGWLLSGDPVLTYNVAVGALRLLSALAMFLLIARWTGVPAAGIVAGLLYAFDLPDADAYTYPFIFDTAWAVLGLFFARRFFQAGRWPDALGLAACCALQLSESFYALLASVLVALPLAAWLAWHYRAAHLRAAPAAVALIVVALAGAAVLGPIVWSAADAQPGGRTFQAFASAAVLAPGGFAGWLAWALAALALVLPRVGEDDADPRWALLAAAALVALVATGGNETARLSALARGEPPPPGLPNLYAPLRAWIPGLDVARAPGYAATGLTLAVCALSGIGAAALLRRVPARFQAAAAGVLIAAAGVAALRPGLPARFPVEPVRLRPARADIAFFEALERKGNRGPLFEVPVQLRVGLGGPGSAISQVLLSAYHGRRTSGCYNSILPRETRELSARAARLPEPSALGALRDLGFTTLVVHHARAPALAPALDAAGLARLHRTPSMSAWALPGDGP